MIKLSIVHILSSVKIEHSLKSCIGNGTFEVRHGTATRMEKRQSARALQQRIQPKGDILDTANWLAAAPSIIMCN
jgi:hypothetical protein